jgi:hypothetical protein
MMRTLHSFVLKISTLPVIATFTVLAAFFFWFIQARGLPVVPGFKAILRIGLPDMMFTYAPASIYEKLTLFGADGRLAYRHFLERVDSLFPAIYGLFFVTATTRGLARIFPTRPALQKLSLLTLAATFFDYAENLCFLIFLNRYPLELAVLEKFANLFTLAKWAFAALSIVLLLIAAPGLFRGSPRGSNRQSRVTPL